MLAITNPIPISNPPKRNSGVMISSRKITPKIVPTIGWAKKVNEAMFASRRANALFHKYIARAVAIKPRKRIPAMTPRVISPIPSVDISHALKAMLVGNPPTNATKLTVRTSTSLVTLRTRTEYRAHVRAAATRLKFPKKRDESSSAVRGSITARTPRDAMNRAIILLNVIFSPRIGAAKMRINAGVAEVTRDPFEADDRFVPTN